MAGNFRGHTFNAMMQPRAVDDRPLTFRGAIAPLGTYANPDGTEEVGLAWPGMITEPLNALQRLHENSYTEDGRPGIPNPQNPENLQDASTLLWSIYGGNALNPIRSGARTANTIERSVTKYDMPMSGGPNRPDGVLWSDTGKPSLMGSAVAGAEGNALGPYERSMIDYLKSERINPAMPQWSNEWQRIKAGETKRYPELNASLLENELARLDSEAASFPGVQDMGWNEGFKHGTKELSPIEQMRPSSDGHLGPGVYVTRRNALAKEYADHGGTPGRIVNMEVRGDALDANQWQAIIENIASGTGKPLESQAVYDAAKNQLRKYGYTGIKSNQGFSVVFDPEDLRPANGAAFFSDTGKPSLMGAAVAGENARPGITAYHGSPHDFDKFSLDKIGTGEGAQAYGHGLYFAENEGVARSYRDSLSSYAMSDDAANILKAAGMNDGELHAASIHLLNARSGHSSRDAARWWARGAGKDLTPDIERAFKEAMRVYDTPGRMYEVRINADPESFLDWDKPLSQQSEAARTAFQNSTAWLDLVDQQKAQVERLKSGGSIFEPTPERIAEFSAPLENSQVADLMRSLHFQNGPKQLREAGIPGIKYLDRTSRAAGEGSRNYVVFDDSIIDILKKYGLAGGAIGAGSLFDFNTDQQY